MKSPEINEFAGATSAGISLKKLIGQLVCSLGQSAAVNKVFILNEVPAGLQLPTGQGRVIPVIKELLATMASNGRNTCISITADRFSDGIVLNFEDQNNYNGYALSFSLMAVERHARFAGGDISVEGVQKKVATVSFSFPTTAMMGNRAYC